MTVGVCDEARLRLRSHPHIGGYCCEAALHNVAGMNLQPLSTTAAPKDAQRFPAPDIARGVMLALIAVANVMIYLHARPYGVHQHILTDSVLDRIVTGIVVTTVDGRAYPMFAALLGYGIVHMVRRRRQRGVPDDQIRRTLRRRNLGLILFGALHAALAFSGDILGWYGLLGLVVVPLMRLGDRALLRLALIWLLFASLFQALALGDATVSTERDVFWSYAIADPLLAAGLRIIEWVMTPFGLLAVFSAILLGVWAGRHRVLEYPQRHRTLLRRTAAIGISGGFVGGAAMALVATEVWAPGPVAMVALSWIHVVTGVGCGLGYAALIALKTAHLPPDGRERGVIVRALEATGQRSLSCYLAQSAVFALLLPAGTLGWGGWLGPAGAAVLSLLTWAFTVLCAALWADRPGPAETLLRQIMRGRRASARATINA